MANTYTKVGWHDGQAPAINAENLNHMDDQIKENADNIDALGESSANALYNDDIYTMQFEVTNTSPVVWTHGEYSSGYLGMWYKMIRNTDNIIPSRYMSNNYGCVIGTGFGESSLEALREAGVNYVQCQHNGSIFYIKCDVNPNTTIPSTLRFTLYVTFFKIKRSGSPYNPSYFYSNILNTSNIGAVEQELNTKLNQKVNRNLDNVTDGAMSNKVTKLVTIFGTVDKPLVESNVSSLDGLNIGVTYINKNNCKVWSISSIDSSSGNPPYTIHWQPHAGGSGGMELASILADVPSTSGQIYLSRRGLSLSNPEVYISYTYNDEQKIKVITDVDLEDHRKVFYVDDVPSGTPSEWNGISIGDFAYSTSNKCLYRCYDIGESQILWEVVDRSIIVMSTLPDRGTAKYEIGQRVMIVRNNLISGTIDAKFYVLTHYSLIGGGEREYGWRETDMGPSLPYISDPTADNEFDNLSVRQQFFYKNHIYTKMSTRGASSTWKMHSIVQNQTFRVNLEPERQSSTLYDYVAGDVCILYESNHYREFHLMWEPYYDSSLQKYVYEWREVAFV